MNNENGLICEGKSTPISEIPPRYYRHPMVDGTIDRLFPNPSVNQSVRYVISMIIWKERFKRQKQYKRICDGQAPDGNGHLSWFNHEFYLRMLSPQEYSHRMNMLVENGILVGSSFTSTKGRHPIYGMGNEALLTGYELVPVTIASVLKKIENYRRWLGRHVASLDLRVMEHIARHFTTIDLDEGAFMQIWKNRYYTRYLKTHKDNPLFWDRPNEDNVCYRGIGENCFKIIESWNQCGMLQRQQLMIVDKFGCRLYHPFTYLPSEVRPYLLNSRGEPFHFTEFDLANSQPALFCNLIVGQKPNLKNTLFVRLVEQYKIYEDLADRLKIERDFAKTEFLHFLYSMAGTKAQETFERYYGPAAIEAGKIKSKEFDEDGNYIPFNERHSQLAKKMQRAESSMFRTIWPELLSKGFVFLPIHDAVYVANLNRSAKKEVLAMMKHKMRQQMSIKFRIKMKRIHKQTEKETREVEPVI